MFNHLIDKKNHVVNFLCLIVKQYIYRQRCLDKKLSWFECKGIISQVENIEKYIAIKNGKLNIHNRKWTFCKPR